MKRTVLYIFILINCCLKLFSQNPIDSSAFKPEYRHGILYTIETTVGTKHTGFVVEETKDYIVLENRNTHEKIEINKSQIVNTKSKKQNTNYNQELLGENEFASNYMLSGSAFLFEEDCSISNNHWLFVQNMDYTLSENWALNVGSFLFYPVSVGVKGAVKLNELNYVGFSANAMGNLFSTSSAASMFWGYALLAKFTHGSSNKNFTISSGLLSLNSTLIDPSSTSSFINIPFVAGAYCNRFNERFAFNAETWLFPQTMVALGGVGFKFLYSERIAWTFGCYTNIISENNALKLDLNTIPIPYIAYARKFK